MQVNDFIAKHVHDIHRPKFRELMREWDGSHSVGLAFYDMDVLWMKLDEAKGN